jgi:hypothetical protein
MYWQVYSGCTTYPGAGADAAHDFSGNQTGFTEAGTNWAANNHCSAVTTAANYSAGPGGGGFRSWYADGTNENSGYLRVAIPSTETHVWVRSYMRHQSGMTFSNPGGNPSYIKHHYWQGPGCGANDCVIWGYEGGGWGLNVDNATNHGGSVTWNDLFGGTTSDGLWHCFEYEIAKGSGTGIVRIWVDGTQTYSATGLTIGGDLTHMLIGENATPVTGAGAGNAWYVDHDELAISATERIGGTGCGS